MIASGQFLEGLSDAEVWAEIQTRRGALTAQQKSVKAAELETLLATADEIGEDRPEGVFYARTLPKAEWDQPGMTGIEKVVLVQSLREVMALVGFTRFEAAINSKRHLPFLRRGAASVAADQRGLLYGSCRNIVLSGNSRIDVCAGSKGECPPKCTCSVRMASETVPQWIRHHRSM